MLLLLLTSRNRPIEQDGTYRRVVDSTEPADGLSEHSQLLLRKTLDWGLCGCTTDQAWEVVQQLRWRPTKLRDKCSHYPSRPSLGTSTIPDGSCVSLDTASAMSEASRQLKGLISKADEAEHNSLERMNLSLDHSVRTLQRLFE